MDTTPSSAVADRIETIREFNRFYTRRIGVLHENLLGSGFTLTESRLLWELAHHDCLTATELARSLELDAGYLSRLLAGFKQRGLLKAARSKDDARHLHLSLTAAGRRAFAPLNSRSQQQVGQLLGSLAEPQQQQLLQAFGQIGRLLDASPERASQAPYRLRSPRPGDIGWVVARHGALYAHEYGWDMRFEALVARIAADFIDRFDAAREACWFAERDGVDVGCVFLVQSRDDATQQPLAGVAQLRLLLVEPSARGLGIGRRLVGECTRFAQNAGYRSIKLWTNKVLAAARHLYQEEGYRLVASEAHHSFGHDLVGETWELALA
jgi:DNA-binding MarR family transcriptional regulator/GNAT superfamily N-acetyltransferase